MITFDLHTEKHWLIADLSDVLRGIGDPAEFVQRHGRDILNALIDAEGLRDTMGQVDDDIDKIKRALNDLCDEVEDEAERPRALVSWVQINIKKAVENISEAQEMLR